MEVCGKLHVPAALPPGKEPGTQEQKGGWPQSRSGRSVKTRSIKICTYLVIPGDLQDFVS